MSFYLGCFIALGLVNPKMTGIAMDKCLSSYGKSHNGFFGGCMKALYDNSKAPADEMKKVCNILHLKTDLEVVIMCTQEPNSKICVRLKAEKKPTAAQRGRKMVR